MLLKKALAMKLFN